jgi:hypothetical protein
MLSLFLTLCISLQHAHGFLSHLLLRNSPGNGFQQRLFPFLLVHELSLYLSHNNSQLTNLQQLHSHFKLNWSELTVSSTWGWTHYNWQLASLSQYQTPIWDPWPDFYYCQTVAGFLMVDGSVVYNCCWTSRGNHSLVRVLQDTWPYFSV